MLALKLGQGLVMVGAAAAGAGLLGLLVLGAAGTLWLAAVGAGAFVLGTVVLAVG